MPHEIKTTLKVDGESKFEKDLKAASKSVKNMGEQLKLATEEYKKNGDKMKLTAERSRTLKSEIEQQEKIVKALEQAVKESAEKFGEASDKTERWQTELTRAQTALAQLQNTLNNNEKGLDANGKAFEDMLGKADEAQEKVNSFKFLEFDTALKNITSAAENAAQMIINVGKSAWNMVSDSGKWADELTTLSDATGIDRQTLQSWNYAARFVDTETGAIIAAIDKVRDKTTSGNKDDLLLFNPLVKTTDAATGKLRDAQDIFWDTVDALHGISDENKRAALAQDIFGKNYRDLMPLIRKGRDEWEHYTEQAREAGYVLSEDQLDNLGSFDDATQRMDASMENLRNTLSAELAPAMETVADAVTKVVDKFTEWANTEEGQRALENLSGAITAVVTSLTENTDFTDLATKAAGAIEGFGQALAWTAEHPEEVVDGIVTALKVYAGLKIGTAALSLITALGELKNLGSGTVNTVKQIMNMLGGSHSGSIPVSNETLNQAKNGAVTTGAGLGAKAVAAGKAAVNFVGGILPTVAVISAAVTPAVIAQNQNIAQARDKTETIKEQAEKAMDTLGEKAGNIIRVVQQAAGALGLSGKKDFLGMDILSSPADVHAALVNALQLDAEDILDKETVAKLNKFRESITTPYAEGLSGQEEYILLQDITDQLLKRLGDTEEMVQYLTTHAEAKKDDASEVAETMASDTENAAETAEEVNTRLETMKKAADDAKAAVKELYQELDEKYGVVQNGQTGQFELINSDNSQEARDGIAALNELYAKAAELKADYEAAGEDIPAGLASGIEKNTQTATDAADTMAADTENAAERRLGINSPSTVFRDIGANVAIGLGNGIYAEAAYAISAAQWLAAQIEAATRSALDIHSPSGVMEELGAFTGEGFALGLEQSADLINNSFARMLSQGLELIAPPVSAQPAPAQAGASMDAIAGLIVAALDGMEIRLDGELVGRSVAPTVEFVIQEQELSRRYTS